MRYERHPRKEHGLGWWRLIHAYVTSRLDGCNSILYGLPDTVIGKLQLIQNAAARLVTRTKPREHILPILQELHWLPIRNALPKFLF